MSDSKRKLLVAIIASSILTLGCRVDRHRADTAFHASDLPSVNSSSKADPSTQRTKSDEQNQSAEPSTVKLASFQENVVPADLISIDETPTQDIRPAYGKLEPLPIDLSSVLQLINANNPSIQFAQARVREAQARLDSAQLQWLPNLSVGTAYARFDGQTQNQAGSVFGVSRSNLLAGGGPALTVSFADAIYRPLIERRMVSSESLRERSVNLSTELEGVSSYLDLLLIHALIKINAETLDRAEEMLTAAENAKESKLDRTAGDVNRAKTEVLLRRAESLDLQAKAGAASARLGRLLLLNPNTELIPAESAIVPVTLVDPTCSIGDLISQSRTNRPDLASQRQLIAAAWERVRSQQMGPLLPKLIVANQTSIFGGGLNDYLGKFDSRNTVAAQLFWEVKNLGYGNAADVSMQRAQLDQARLQYTDTQAKITSDIIEAAQMAAAKYESLDLAQQAVGQASELYRIVKEGTENMVDARNLYDGLRPLQSIQMLNQTQQQYLSAVVEFNRAQYRLFTYVGCPASNAPNDL